MKTIHLTLMILFTFAIFAGGCESYFQECKALPLEPTWIFSNGKYVYDFKFRKRKCSIKTAYGRDTYKGRYSSFIIEPAFNIKEAELITESGKVIKGMIETDSFKKTELKFYMEVPDVYAKDKYLLIINGSQIRMKLRVTREVTYILR